MTGRILLGCFLFILTFPWSAPGAYFLNGKPSQYGAYVYDCSPKKGYPFDGDVEKTFLPFSIGALMDAKGEDLGKSVCFGQNPNSIQIRTVFFDLGRTVSVESVTVRSRLAAWWGVCGFNVAFSTDGRSFMGLLDHPGKYPPKPHTEGLYVRCPVKAGGTAARFIRIQFTVFPWNDVQIGEIDIQAKTTRESLPVEGPFDLRQLKDLYRCQVDSPAVDAFGQWTREDWSGKVKTESELVHRIRAEETRYADVKIDPDRLDRFGGDKTLGIKSKPANTWRLEKLAGRWWFITPEGNPFLMVAVDAVNIFDGINMNTFHHKDIPGLEKNFEWIPPKDGPFAPCFWSPEPGIDRFSFFMANLVRVFGKDYHQRFYRLARNRLRDWGFNSLGKWNWQNEAHHMNLPFIITANPQPAPNAPVSGCDGLADPWDTNFPAAVENTFKSLADQYGKNPFFIGITIGNEEWWHETVTQAVLKSVPACPAKEAFADFLVRKNPKKWKSVQDLLTKDLNALRPGIDKAIAEFIELSSRRYYSTWRDARNRLLPGRLILGSSFVLWWRTCPEWVKGSIPFTDAMMLDMYPTAADPIIKQYVEPYAVPADKPVLIGEYGLTTRDRGFIPFGSNVASQKERGLHYRKINEALFAHPNWVGSMWFMYRDEVPLGRDFNGKGESHNFGLVDICNLPYYDMIDEMRATNQSLFRIHAGKEPE